MKFESLLRRFVELKGQYESCFWNLRVNGSELWKWLRFIRSDCLYWGCNMYGFLVVVWCGDGDICEMSRGVEYIA